MSQVAHAKPNAHFVDHLIELSAENSVLTTCDIYSDSGIKLLMRGVEITPHLRERLLQHRLTQPLERCLEVSDAVNAEELSKLVRQIAEERPELSALCGLGAGLTGTEGRSDKRWWSLAYLRSVPLDSVSLLLLTMGRRNNGGPLRHAVLVTLIALGLGRRLRVPEDTLCHLTTAGLLHDVGELYIDPQTLDPNHHVTIREWRGIVAHPVVGFKLLNEVGGVGAEPARAVLEHHERWDGSGYPRGVLGKDTSLAGHLLATAEMIAGLLNKSGVDTRRAGIALKALSPGLSPEVLAALGESLSQTQGSHAHATLPEVAVVAAALEQTARLLVQVDQALTLHRGDSDNALVQAFAHEIQERFNLIKAAFLRTGPGSLPLADVTALLHEPDAEELVQETADVCDEIRWRLRELTRTAVMRVAHMPEYCQPEASGLLTAL
ncbi:HD-GYP domain-containing protein [Chitinimonas sp.]|uniref:HD-GYP domain-containing protein n=1 Tax=Chitinimonas sp. TaxID=1934313 RepID=UPI002F92E790